MDKYIVNYNIIEIDFNTILPIWKNELWPTRSSSIESHSAMTKDKGVHDVENFKLPAWFYGVFDGNNLIGVNSTHLCTDGSLRIRGFWVAASYRGQGVGTNLLVRSIDDAKKNQLTEIWSYPRKSSWPIFEKLGFIMISDWEKSETSDANVFCYLILK